ncbi:site-specific DNA-methyltransferase [Halomonas meridiana]|uniref:site-specific DNA-methyltransferase n=1 Tax=Vreelandella aquamarina TaxID=77097 RepID=UPI001E28BB94|nr:MULTISPECIES: site-specific DNA-methyltransferase [Halomonas]MCD1653057.1 site-specific DNA-methyltransferase [Halomonas axialensis]MCD2089430.1 site-specific DNA-methyltransferase [Halomonas meridiana]
MDTSHHTTEINELGHSPDAQQERQQQLLNLLRQTAPEVISDNQLNLERLKELMGEERLAPAEHYELSWAGKKDARREIQKKTSHTLRPDANNPESAQHMLIEGENLEVLRVLQKSYYGKVKMIYIDPPYNTGNDSFVYPDDYSETLDEYQKRTGEKNEAGFLNKQSLWKKNSKESGQYHSAWLSMMYPRLYLARNLLREDGVIFISIDDNEAANLKLLCDEVFGEDNLLANIVWEKVHTRKNSSKYFSTSHEHILAYAKFKNNWDRVLLPREGESAYKNPDDNPKGPWKLDPITAHNEYSADYKITKPNGVILSRPQGRYWAFSEESIKKKIEDKEIVWGEGDGYPMIKRFLSEVQDGLIPITIFNRKFAGDTSLSKKELDDILGFQGGFSYTKPTRLVKRLMQISCRPQDIVFDFFAGSGTTAHAVMELNAEDGGNRQSISVQLPEKLEENSEAYKAGYRTIADITRARIEKVIAKLKAEHPEKTEGLACAHFTLAPSNFKVWNSELNDPGAIRQQLDALQNTEKHADEQTAMLTELLLKNGLGALGVHAVSKPRTLACGVTVHRVLREDDRYLWLCFEPYVDAVRDEILNANPAQVIMLNSCFTGTQGDEQLSNLQLELAAQDISLLVI